MAVSKGEENSDSFYKAQFYVQAGPWATANVGQAFQRVGVSKVGGKYGLMRAV